MLIYLSHHILDVYLKLLIEKDSKTTEKKNVLTLKNRKIQWFLSLLQLISEARTRQWFSILLLQPLLATEDPKSG